MKLLGNFNIKCNSERECKEVQQALFDLGYKWNGETGKNNFLEFTNYPIYLSLSADSVLGFVWSTYKPTASENYILYKASNIIRMAKMKNLEVM